MTDNIVITSRIVGRSRTGASCGGAGPLAGAGAPSHAHDNKQLLDKITAVQVDAWDAVVSGWGRAFSFDEQGNLHVKTNLVGEQEVCAYGTGTSLPPGSGTGGGTCAPSDGQRYVHLVGKPGAVTPLTDSMLVKADTIYVIRDDFEVTRLCLPHNSTLKFEGGSIRGGVVVGDNSSIDAGRTQIFEEVSIEGTWRVTDIYQDWFDFSPLANFDNKANFKNMVALSNENVHNTIHINDGVWYTSKTDGLFVLNSNTTLLNSGEVKVLPNNDRHHSLVIIQGDKAGNKYTHNVNVIGGIYTGDIQQHTMSSAIADETDEWNHGIKIGEHTYNIAVSGVISRYHHGDGIDMVSNGGGNEIHHITIDGCVLDNNGRQGISIEDGEDIVIRKCKLTNTGKSKVVLPAAGIDFEPWIDKCKIQNVRIEDCIYENNVGGDVMYMPFHAQLGSRYNDNIIFSHCRLNSFNAFDAKGLKIMNCDMYDTPAKVAEITLNQAVDCIIENTGKFNLSLNPSSNIKLEYCKIGANDLNQDTNNVKYENCEIDSLDCWGANSIIAFRSAIHKITLGMIDNALFDKCVISDINAYHDTAKNNVCRDCDLHFKAAFTQSLGEMDYYNCNFVFEDGYMKIHSNNTKVVKCHFEGRGAAYKTEHAIEIDTNKTGVPITATLIDNDFEGYQSLYNRIEKNETVNVFSSKPIRLNDYDDISHPMEGCWDNLYGIQTRIFCNKKWVSFGPVNYMPPEGSYIGENYFDTSIGKVKYWDGFQWVDALGAPVAVAAKKTADSTNDTADSTNDTTDGTK